MSTENSVDPRVQVELEKLNTATDNINKYEVELDEAKSEFKKILAESVQRIKQSAHKLGNSIEAAKPYYESRIYAAQLTKETQTAAANYEKAKSIHAAAKEMVYLAEQGLGEKSTLDTACQEMLSHAASKVNQSQLEVTDARNSLKMCQLKLEVANNRVGKLQGQLKQAIKASRPYYETRANYNGLLKAQKLKINELEGKVSDAKMTYNEALKNLEQISEEIHRQRQQKKVMLNYEAMLQQAEADERQQRHIRLASGDATGCLNADDDDDDDVAGGALSHDDHLISNYQASFPCDIDSSDEYLTMPDQLSSSSSPIRQRKPDVHDCPHLLRDFETVLTFPQKLAGGMHKSASTSATGSGDNVFASQMLHGPYELKASSGGGSGGNTTHDISSSTNTQDDNDIEQWTEIRLSHSDSTSSSYSNQSLLHDQHDAAGGGVGGGGGGGDNQSHHSSSSDEPKRKVTCTTIFHEETKKQGLSQWLSRSNSFKMSGRRQSLDLLIDAGDKVKDVFSFGFQKVRSMERRNSESEMNSDDGGGGGGGSSAGAGSGGSGAGVGLGSSNTSSATDFFLFSRSSEPKELLSDEQVENLLISHRVDETGAIIVEELKSPLQQPSMITVPASTPSTGSSLFFL